MLKVEHLNQYYGGSHILRDVSFEAPIGKVTTLLGRNGVGKTTLLKCLTGLVAAKTGSIAFKGQELTRTATARLTDQEDEVLSSARDLLRPCFFGTPFPPPCRCSK